MNKKLIFLFLTMISLLKAERVDVISDWNISDIQIDWTDSKYFGCEIVQHTDFNSYANSNFSKSAKKIICMNDIGSQELLAKFPKEKLVAFLWEPAGVAHSYAQLFSRVYTHDDRKVDNNLYFKLYYPFLRSMTENVICFEKRKLATLITFDWTEERRAIVDFYNTKPIGDFEFYGYDASNFKDNIMYQGKIPGYHSGPEKNEVLQRYRFCYCYENSHIPGYITEKIFACFKAGCVPIYFGAPNIEQYIPKGCFIDLRDFSDHESLYRYIKSMNEERYMKYLNNIKSYLSSEGSFCFSPENFKNLLFEIIWSDF